MIFFLLYVIVLVIVMIALLWPQLSAEIEAKKKYGSDRYVYASRFPVAGGINLPAGTMCHVALLYDSLVISANNQRFSLPCRKIVDVSVMTKKEIQKQYVSSIGGAIAGGILLGPLGAVIGGSATQRTIKNNTAYLIFSYESDAQIKYILFHVKNQNKGIAKRFKSMSKGLIHQETVNIEL